MERKAGAHTALGKGSRLPLPGPRVGSQPGAGVGGRGGGEEGRQWRWLTHRAHTHQPAADTAPGAQDQEPVLVGGEGVLHDVALLQEAVGQGGMPAWDLMEAQRGRGWPLLGALEPLRGGLHPLSRQRGPACLTGRSRGHEASLPAL